MFMLRQLKKASTGLYTAFNIVYQQIRYGRKSGAAQTYRKNYLKVDNRKVNDNISLHNNLLQSQMHMFSDVNL